MTDDEMTAPNPYVGPRPFERQDSPRFFGRDQEARELFSLIVANRAVVLYAPSGAGKTSLLNAQVVPLLEAEGFEVWPIARVHGPRPVGLAPEQISNIYALHAILSWEGAKANLSALHDETLTSYLSEFLHVPDESGYERPRLLIYDQFEELFTTYPSRWPEREGFLNQVARALESDPLLRVVFSLREDYLAQLDPYAHLLPRNLGVRFRLERMRPEAALAAIRGPLRETERNFAPGVAEQLVEDLRVVRLESATGELQTVKGEFVEPVQLQVVCQNLWEDLPAEVTTITEEHLRTFGNVDQALASFYERAVNRALPLAGVDEETLRNWFEASLITPAGTRGTVYRGTQQTEGIANEAVETLEDMHLIRGEFRAGSRWYELTHDRLIVPIQQSNRRWKEARQAARIKRIRQGAMTAVILIALIALFLLTFQWVRNNTGGIMPEAEVRQTATAYVEEVGEVATGVVGTATAQEGIVADAQATAAVANATATAAIALATNEAVSRETVAAQTAVAQQATQTAVAQAIAHATATAAVVNPTSTAVAAEATRTFLELERLRSPVRPLQPGISIGNQNSNTAGTLSAFAVDNQGVYYLLGPNFPLGAADAPVLQPSPIDGGTQEDAVARTARRIPLTDLPTIDAALFINLAQLEPGIAFQMTVPGVGSILGVREPQLEDTVWVYGRTSGLVERTISCVGSCSVTATDGAIVNAAFLLDRPLASGDEGALVLDADGYAVGIVAANAFDVALGAGMTAVLEQFDVELVTGFEEVSQLLSPGGSVIALATHPNGRSLAVADNGGQIALWDIADPLNPPTFPTGQLGQENTAKQLYDPFSDIAFNSDGTLLAAGNTDHTLHLWQMAEDSFSASWLGFWWEYSPPLSITFHPTAPILAVGGWQRGIIIYGVSQPENELNRLEWLEHNSDSVRDLGYSADGSRLGAAVTNGALPVWNMTTDELIASLPVRDYSAISFSPNGRYLAAADTGGTIYLWLMDNLDNEPLVLSGHSGAINSLVFQPNSQLLASASEDGSIRLWSLIAPARDPIVLNGHQGAVTAVTFTTDGHYLISGGEDATLRFWTQVILQKP
jgi:WD40 repeat protein